MMIACERDFLKAHGQFEQIVERVQLASQQERRIDEVERTLFSDLLALGHTLLKGFVEAAGDGDRGETLMLPAQPTNGLPEQAVPESANGEAPSPRTLKRLPDPHSRRYVSIFGELEITRFVYGTREGQAIEAVPLDAQLGLPAGDFSYVLEDWQQRLCVKEALGEATADLRALLGVAPSVRAAEVMNRKLAEFAPGFRAEQLPPPAQEEAEIFVFTADGKGVPMRRPAGEKRAHGQRRRKGEKANKKQMACVGAVYSIDPFVRTADEVLDELERKEAAYDRPQPQHKHVLAEMTRVLDGETFNGRVTLFAELSDELRMRNRRGRKPVVALMDGEAALWEAQREFLPEAVGILDLFHVLERLWNAAHVFHAEGSPKAKAFVDRRLRMLLEGQVGAVIGGFKQMLTKQRLKGSKRRALQTVIGYFENNREHMRYDEYLAAGYPIGSGVAEGACRHLVKDRMEQTGMRWVVDGAQAMLHLRALYLNGDWNNFVT
jgi:hypothetical protein